MKTLKHIFFSAVAASSLLMSCSATDNKNNKTPLVRVYDSYLYYEDLGDLVPKGASKADSAKIVSSYINVWARQQLMIKKAELYLSPEQKDVEKRLEEYRNNLLTYKYKDEFIAQNLDTVVTEEQALEYYNSHPDDFKLNNTIVQAIFVQVSLNNDDYVRTIRKLLDFHNESDSLELLEFCKLKATRFDNFESRWITLAEAARNLPEQISEKNDMVKSHGVIKLSDSEFVYLLKIRNSIPTGGVMPFEMAKYTISRTLTNKRTTKLITELEQNIYDNAVNSGNLEYFSSKQQDDKNE